MTAPKAHDTYLGVVYGVRRWRVTSGFNSLSSLTMNAVDGTGHWYPTGEATTATCRFVNHRVVMPQSCTCGIYSDAELCSDAITLSKTSMGDPQVLGVVALWGIIVQHEFGYRAQHARIEALDATSLTRAQSSAWSDHAMLFRNPFQMADAYGIGTCVRCSSHSGHTRSYLKPWDRRTTDAKRNMEYAKNAMAWGER